MIGCALNERALYAVLLQLPIKKKMTDAFGVFNKFYTSVPSASIPNHMYAQSATSCGLHDNIGYNSCGGPAASWGFPQLTIYDSLSLHNISFGELRQQHHHLLLT